MKVEELERKKKCNEYINQREFEQVKHSKWSVSPKFRCRRESV